MVSIKSSFQSIWKIIIIYGMKITYSFLNVTILKRENCPETRIKLINLSESNIKPSRLQWKSKKYYTSFLLASLSLVGLKLSFDKSHWTDPRYRKESKIV